MAGVVNTFVERLVRNRGKEHTRPSLQKRTVLLIGPTGEGKSTVGSFLADPTNHARNPVFQRATSNAPQTSKTESSGVKVLPVMGGMQECEFEFVDTPGLNEGKAQDLEHMVDVFQCLQQKQKISAIVLVYKHDSKISEPLKRLLGFYRRFFGGLLASNFFVILSNFRWDQQSIENRSADSYSLVKVKKQIEMELRDVLEISSSITILDIDARPGSWVPSSSGMQDPSPTEAFSELGQALARRSRVLDKVFTLPLVDVAQLRFAKLPAMVEEDEALKNQLRERVTGYVDNYKRMSKELVIKGTELQSLNNTLRDLESSTTALTDQLGSLKAITEVEVAKFEEERLWKFGMHNHQASFELPSKFKPCRVAVIAAKDPRSGATATVQHETKLLAGRYIVQGKASGMGLQYVPLIYSMYVSIVVYVDVEVLHEEKIKELKKSISDNTVEQRVRSEEMKKVLAQHEHYQKELNELQQYIDATYARQKALEHDYLSLDDAIIRLNALRAQKSRNLDALVEQQNNVPGTSTHVVYSDANDWSETLKGRWEVVPQPESNFTAALATPEREAYREDLPPAVDSLQQEITEIGGSSSAVLQSAEDTGTSRGAPGPDGGSSETFAVQATDGTTVGSDETWEFKEETLSALGTPPRSPIFDDAALDRLPFGW